MSNSPTKGDLVVFASPVSRHQWEQLKALAQSAKVLAMLYVFFFHSNLLMPLMMLYAIFQRAL